MKMIFEKSLKTVAFHLLRWGARTWVLGACLSFCSAGWAAPETSAQTWQQWRGPDRDGSVKGEWPAVLDEARFTQQWTAKLGKGYASPIISEDKVFTVETQKKTTEVVRAFDRQSGKQLWEVSWEGAMTVPFFAKKNGSWVRSTPAFDGRFLYVGGIRDVLVCLAAEDGAEQWRIDFTQAAEAPLPAFGFVSSPVLDGDLLYVQAGAGVQCIEKATGKILWTVLQDKRAMYGSAFSSPVIHTLQGKRQLVVQTRALLAGIDLESGAVLWSTEVKSSRRMNILTPLVIESENRIFTATYGGGAMMYQVNEDNEEYSIEQIWMKEKLEGYMASPLLLQSRIFLFGRDKRLHCLSLEGEELWRSQRKFGEYWSMVSNGADILALDERAELYLIDAEADAFVLKNKLDLPVGSSTWAHLALADQGVFVRDLIGVTAYQWK